MVLKHPPGVKDKLARKLSDVSALDLFAAEGKYDSRIQFIAWSEAKHDKRGIPRGTILPVKAVRSSLRAYPFPSPSFFDAFCLAPMHFYHSSYDSSFLEEFSYGSDKFKNRSHYLEDYELCKAVVNYLQSLGTEYPDTFLMQALGDFIKEHHTIAQAKAEAYHEGINVNDVPALVKSQQQHAQDRNGLMTLLGQSSVDTEERYKDKRIERVTRALLGKVKSLGR